MPVISTVSASSTAINCIAPNVGPKPHSAIPAWSQLMRSGIGVSSASCFGTYWAIVAMPISVCAISPTGAPVRQ